MYTAEKPAEHLIVALDVSTEDRAMEPVNRLREVGGMLQSRNSVVSSAGPDIVR